ncbi:MAG: RND family transporter, partial [Acidobacteria bacterium]
MVTKLENLVFGNRRLVVALFAVLTLFMLYQATHLKIDAGFAKLLPLEHQYMQTYLEYRDEFGGANRVVIAIRAREGNIFTPRFFEVLRQVTDEVFFIPGVDRTRVMSLFTPNVRFTEVVEDGISGGNVIPDDFAPTPEGLAKVRENILKSAYMGRLVANDFSAAIVV